MSEKLRLALEDQLRLWRHEAEPEHDDDGSDRAGRAALGVAANELAAILKAHPAEDAPGGEPAKVIVVERDEPCAAWKFGLVDLKCELPEGHAGWHQATFRKADKIEYPGAVHHATLTEEVSWEPDMRHEMFGRIARKAGL